MLSRIAIIRPSTVMVAGARGGLGGISSSRATGISWASAMLIFRSAISRRGYGAVVVATGLSMYPIRRDKGATGRKRLIRQLGDRYPVFGGWPGPRHNPFLVEHRHHGAARFRSRNPQCRDGIGRHV